MHGTKIPAMFAILAVFTVMAVSGCTTGSPTASPTATPTENPTTAPVTGAVVLTIAGNVNTPLNLTMADLNKYPTKYVSASWNATKKGLITVNATGALLNNVLDAAGPKSTASNVTFKGSNGSSKTVRLSDIRASPDAIIGFMDDGTLRDVIPGQPAGTWMSNLTAIEVQ